MAAGHGRDPKAPPTGADQPAGEPIDLYHDGVKPSEERTLGTFDLAAGQNKLTVEIVGANEKAVRSCMFGLDYLRLEAAE